LIFFIKKMLLIIIIINVCIVQYESLVWVGLGWVGLGWGGVRWGRGGAKPGTTWEAPQNGIWAMWVWDAAIGTEVVKPTEVMVHLLQQLS
jgi:hypothetical protein